MVEEAKEVVQNGKGNVSKTTIVSNTPDLKSLNKNEIILNDHLQLIKNRFSAIYTGGIQMGRGIQVILDAIPEIVKKISDFLFVIVGDGYATEQLKKIVHRKQLHDYVLWTGYLDHKKIYDYIRLSKVGLIPHLVSKHVNTTIPNKIFDYMAFELPVIAANAEPMKRILKEENCGTTFKSGDYKDFARVFLQLKEHAQFYGKQGRAAVLNKYNWQKDEQRLLQVIEIFNQ